MEVECNKAWVSSSPESRNSQMACPLFFPHFVHIMYLASGFMVKLEKLLHSANVTEEDF